MMRVLAAAALLMICAALPSACSAQQAAPSAAAEKKPRAAASRAVWVWGETQIAQIINQTEAREKFFVQLHKAGIETLFLNPNDLLNAEPLPATDAKHLNRKQLADFLAAAHRSGFDVQALQGDPEFARTANHKSALDRFQRLLNFNENAAPQQRFDGMQWDIEPYTLPEFAAGGEKREALMSQLLQLCDEMRVLANAAKVPGKTPFALGFAMPFWMDSAEQNTTFRGVAKPTTFHLIDILKPLPESYIALMSYRDSAPQTIEVAAQEIKYARDHAPNVKIWVGQETNELKDEPRVVTYFDEGREAFQKALAALETHYRDDKNVAGIAIHDWDGLQNLPSRP